MTLETDILIESEEKIHELMILCMMYIFCKKNLIGPYGFFFLLSAVCFQVLSCCLNAAITQGTACRVHPSLHSWLQITFVAWRWERKVRDGARRKVIRHHKTGTVHFLWLCHLPVKFLLQTFIIIRKWDSKTGESCLKVC